MAEMLECESGVQMRVIWKSVGGMGGKIEKCYSGLYGSVPGALINSSTAWTTSISSFYSHRHSITNDCFCHQASPSNCCS